MSSNEVGRCFQVTTYFFLGFECWFLAQAHMQRNIPRILGTLYM